MHTPREIYEKYRIPPWLQLHQLRVAAVGKMVAEAQQGNIDTRQIVLACLFHDMGNILKFDISPTGPLAPLFGKKGFDYWREVQQEFAQTHGTDEHAASVAIARAIGLPPAACTIVDRIGFANVKDLFAHNSRELWIAQYADMRVGPYGIISMQERIEDLKKRYATKSAWFGRKELSMISENILQEVEHKLFSHGTLAPDGITNTSVAPIIEKLRDYSVTAS